jgi:hypothetical protein
MCPLGVTILRASYSCRCRRGFAGAEGRCPFSPPNRLPPRTTDEIAEAVNFVAFRFRTKPVFPFQPHRSRGPWKQRAASSTNKKRRLHHEYPDDTAEPPHPLPRQCPQDGHRPRRRGTCRQHRRPRPVAEPPSPSRQGRQVRVNAPSVPLRRDIQQPYFVCLGTNPTVAVFVSDVPAARRPDEPAATATMR